MIIEYVYFIINTINYNAVNACEISISFLFYFLVNLITFVGKGMKKGTNILKLKIVSVKLFIQTPLLSEDICLKHMDTRLIQNIERKIIIYGEFK